jgi:hypothetical protein
MQGEVALAALDGDGWIIGRTRARNRDPDFLRSSPRSLRGDRACKFNSGAAAQLGTWRSEALSV